jgi:microcystin-dependent protein
VSGPHSAPTVGIFDEPGIPICLNSEWASFVDGALALLAARSYWKGTEAEIDAAVDQVEILLAALGEIGDCMVSATPIGAILMHSVATAPAGWLICDGAEVSRDTYALLFAAVGETWGPGDSMTTFNLPDFSDRSPMGTGGGIVSTVGSAYGAQWHTLTEDEMPTHNHTVNDPGHDHRVPKQSATVNAAVNVATPAARTDNPAAPHIRTETEPTNITLDSAGNSAQHNNVHPVRGVPFIIFAGLEV